MTSMRKVLAVAVSVACWHSGCPKILCFLMEPCTSANRIRRKRTGRATTRTAAKIGMNNFRHWVMWSAIEVAPDQFDWRDYDRMMDLAGQSGIKVTLAEMITAAPEWMFDKYRSRTISRVG